jgi:fructokinase
MLLSCGDALIDFLPAKSADGRDAIVPVVGGSCLNIAVGMARLGGAAGFVGGISSDMFGRMIADHARASGVELRYTTRSAHQNTLAFVRSVAGEPQYAFYDQGTASRNWTYRAGSIPFGEIAAVHVGSTTLIDEAGVAQALAMVREARRSTTISFDPNFVPVWSATRPDMSRVWPSLPPSQTSSACRTSTLTTCMAIMTMPGARSR